MLTAPLRRASGLLPCILLLAACGTEDVVGPTSVAATPSDLPGAPNPCTLLDEGTVATALQGAGSTGASGGGASSSAPAVSTVHTIVKMPTTVGRKQSSLSADQCTYGQRDGAVVVTILPITKGSSFTGLQTLTDFTTGAKTVPIGDAASYQETPQAASLAVQRGSMVIVIVLQMAEPTQGPSRMSRVEALAGAALNVPVPTPGPPPTPGAVASGTSSSSSASSSAAGGPGQQVSGQTAAATVKESDQLKFSPTSVTVKTGGVVEWDNSGTVAHNVTFDQYDQITSDTMNGGDKYQVKFTTAGTYQYHCTFHPGMNGTVTVQ